MQGLSKYVPAKTGARVCGKQDAALIAQKLRDYCGKLDALSWALDAAHAAQRSATNDDEKNAAQARAVFAHRAALRVTQALNL